MTIVLTIIHIVVCLFLILVVLAQQGKGQDLASAFGGGGSSAAFGARGTATLLSKVTTVAAILFMLTSLGLTYLKPAVSEKTVVPSAPAPESQATQPATQPGTPAPAQTEPSTPKQQEPQEDATKPDAGKTQQEQGAKTSPEKPSSEKKKP